MTIEQLLSRDMMNWFDELQKNKQPVTINPPAQITSETTTVVKKVVVPKPPEKPVKHEIRV